MTAPPSYREQLVLAARAAMDQLTGPERVEVISHYLGSASKAQSPRVVFESCDCCDCGAP